jgi:eukaryotic-like serine/threonine-protein kinase
MATLWRASSVESEKEFVLKIPCTDILNQPILFYHYQTEAQISPLLNHPGIIRFFQQKKSRLYIIMEYVAANDLRSMLGCDRKITLDNALHLILQLCDVTAYLHKQSIYHLDLKPENILLNQNDTIKVIDFGLASCALFPDLLAADFKNPQGTPWYISPEQLLGKRNSAQCDIYAIGMILYEMLCGSLPWPRSGKLAVARRRLRHEPIPPRFFNPDIPPQVQDIILKSIARKVSNRYRTIADLQSDLNSWTNGAITMTGRNRKKPTLWKRLFPAPTITLDSNTDNTAPPPREKQQIIGAIIDSVKSEPMLTEVKKIAFLQSAEVTLIHVIEEDTDSHFRRYGIKVEGEQLMIRLEQACQILSRCNIQPHIRLIRGEVVETLTKVCKEINANLLIIGSSRKKEGLLRSASVLRRLQRDTPCPLLIADRN